MKDYNKLLDDHLKRIKIKYDLIFDYEFEKLITSYHNKRLVTLINESPELASIIKSLLNGNSLRESITPYLTPDLFEI